MGYDPKLIERKLRNKYAQIEKLKSNNERHKKLEEELDKLLKLQKDYEDYMKLLKKILLNVQLEYQDFRERRLEFLNESITNKIMKIFPNRGMMAKIVYEEHRGQETAKLILVDPLGRVSKPKIAEGDLCKYLICYAAIESVIISLGKNKIFIDEAFGVASETNKPRIGEILHRSASNGMQIILISQDKELYEGVPHREFWLQLDEITNEAHLVKEVDVD